MIKLRELSIKQLNTLKELNTSALPGIESIASPAATTPAPAGR